MANWLTTLLLLAAPAFGQGTDATIAGVVSDPTGEPVPGPTFNRSHGWRANGIWELPYGPGKALARHPRAGDRVMADWIDLHVAIRRPDHAVGKRRNILKRQWFEYARPGG